MHNDEPKAIKIFRELMKTHHLILNKTLNKYGLYKGQPYTLMLLQKNPGMTQKELADEIKVTKATMGASLKRMEKAGFVVRMQDTVDTRCNRITITKKGLQALQDCEKDLYEIRKAMFSKIEKEEEDLAADIFEKMHQGLMTFEGK